MGEMKFDVCVFCGWNILKRDGEPWVHCTGNNARCNPALVNAGECYASPKSEEFRSISIDTTGNLVNKARTAWGQVERVKTDGTTDVRTWQYPYYVPQPIQAIVWVQCDVCNLRFGTTGELDLHQLEQHGGFNQGYTMLQEPVKSKVEDRQEVEPAKETPVRKFKWAK